MQISLCYSLHEQNSKYTIPLFLQFLVNASRNLYFSAFNYTVNFRFQDMIEAGLMYNL